MLRRMLYETVARSEEILGVNSHGLRHRFPAGTGSPAGRGCAGHPRRLGLRYPAVGGGRRLAPDTPPKIWLQSEEKYFPYDVESFLDNTHVEIHKDDDDPNQQFRVTNEPLGCDSCTDPPFLYGQQPKAGVNGAVPLYAESTCSPRGPRVWTAP